MYCELSASYLNTLTPFFASQQRSLRVDLTEDTQKVILQFCYIAGGRHEKSRFREAEKSGSIWGVSMEETVVL